VAYHTINGPKWHYFQLVCGRFSIFNFKNSLKIIPKMSDELQLTSALEAESLVVHQSQLKLTG
jgi:hypothetical protein